MKQQNEKGVTLIALAVTIIVIIILASISIGSIQGRDSTVKNAREEVSNAERESIIEKIEADLYNEKVKTGETPDKYSLKEIIQENGYNEGELGNTSFVTKDGGYEIQYNEIIGWEWTLVSMFKQAQEDGCTGENCDNADHLHIGDYLAYNPIATGDTLQTENADGTLKYKYESLSNKNGYTSLEKQVYSVNNDTEKVNWIVLGLSENEKNLLITTGSPVRKEGTNNPTNDNPYFYLNGLTGYINAEDELNSISAIYGKGDYATGARSITADDINKLTGYDPETEKYAEGQLYEYGNTVTIKGNGDGTYSWKGKTNGTFSGDHKTNGFSYIINNELKNIAPTDTTTTLDLTSTYYYYTASSYVGNKSSIYNKFFNTGDSAYWLASRYVYLYSNQVYFRVGCVGYGNVDSYYLFYSNGVDAGQRYGVRPVVSLEAGTTEENIKILEEQTETEW